MRDFLHRANIDHYLELLNDPDLIALKRATIVKLLVAEEDKLSHDQEQLEFAESRARQGQDRLKALRHGLEIGQLTNRKRAERLIANIEAIQQLLEGFCSQFRDRVNDSRL